MNHQTIEEYLQHKSIPYKQQGDELLVACVFSGCDDDSRDNERHLYFSKSTGQYHCKKCDKKGNLVTLKEHFGDQKEKPSYSRRQFNPKLIEKYHQEMPEHIREYLHNRHITDEIIEKYKIGYGKVRRKDYITIPIKSQYGNYAYLKLRQDPNQGKEKLTEPNGEAQLYGRENLKYTHVNRLVICEGELDMLTLESKGVAAVTSTHGANTFKKPWAEEIKRATHIKDVYVCYDNDDAGRKGAQKVAKMLHDEVLEQQVHIITLPKETGKGGDVTDYFVELNGAVDELFTVYAQEYPEKIDTSRFNEMNADDVIEILDATIKHDNHNKLATLLCMLSAYTENGQFNISYNAPSSTGKSYIPMETAKLFSPEDVIELAYCSPKAFFHDRSYGEYNEDENSYLVDFSRKILIFLDQPHSELLSHLRPMLSHDKKEVRIKITDGDSSGKRRTKDIILRGYPAVIFCTAGMRIDAQEATRFLLLSPETHQAKLKESITSAIRYQSNQKEYAEHLHVNNKRNLFKERLRAIRNEEIDDIDIENQDYITKRFFENKRALKPRHQRDVKRLTSLIKAFALLNMWWRKQNGKTITANTKDIDAAFELWERMSVAQELNIPPYIFQLYQEILIEGWLQKNQDKKNTIGLSRQEIADFHYRSYGRMLDATQFRQQILPMLVTAGLVSQESSEKDKRQMLITPKHVEIYRKRNSEQREGVKVTSKPSLMIS